MQSMLFSFGERQLTTQITINSVDIPQLGKVKNLYNVWEINLSVLQQLNPYFSPNKSFTVIIDGEEYELAITNRNKEGISYWEYGNKRKENPIEGIFIWNNIN